MILVSIFNAKFSSIFYILISGGIGLFIYSIGYFKNKLKAKAQVADGIDTAPTIENNQDNTTAQTCMPLKAAAIYLFDKNALKNNEITKIITNDGMHIAVVATSEPINPSVL